jgi:gamma-glutamyltranspeptidase/glutathione hydrolase
MKASVSAGHPLTCEAAAVTLRQGGNAFDAVCAAGFASALTEPSLSSLGGGGFLLAHEHEQNRDALFDFFVDTPGKGADLKTRPNFFPIKVTFQGAVQEFHIGMGSVAVPGVLKGLVHAHSRLGRLSLQQILQPAIKYASEGVVLNERQAYFLRLLKPIQTFESVGQCIYKKPSGYVDLGDRIYNPLTAIFLSNLPSTGAALFYQGGIGKQLAEAMDERGGYLTLEDLKAYQVIEREPLTIRYRDYEVLTNPPPSSGGVILGLYLAILDKIDMKNVSPLSLEHLIPLAEIMKIVESLRAQKLIESTYPMSEEIALSYARQIKTILSSNAPKANAGTTHINVIDEQGNAASMTLSNGEGSGCYVPGVGIMLNNMLGEDDLHPEGFHAFTPGVRVSSMMCPTIIKKDGSIFAVMGSGGSKRIKTAIFQAIVNLIDFAMPLSKAVESPRIHYDDSDSLHLEPGVNPTVIEELKKQYNVNEWEKQCMYFGGVHTASYDGQAWGDSRRGGAAMSISIEQS